MVRLGFKFPDIISDCTDADAYMRLLWVRILNLVVLRMSDQTYFALEGISSTIFCPVKKTTSIVFII